ncbi:DMT family transporter [Vulcanisaeta thermophila]|uniref:DMT family transporter n=1 Tax=Vulcanisaeta thermophila TaxID=867917 RepID=UPI00085332FF|nr:DMT family transporter [Vulcanisaeta thermophila]
MPYEVLGIALALGASVLWSLSPILYKVGASDDALDDLFSNSLGAFILAVPLIALSPPLNLNAWLYASLFSILGPVLGTYVFLISIRYADVGITNALSYAYIVFLPLIMSMVSPGYLVYLWPGSLVLMGILLIMHSGRGRLIGYSLALLSALLYALSFYAMYLAYDYTNAWGIIFIRGLILMAASLMLKVALGKPRFTISRKILMAGILSYGIGGPLYVASVQYAGIVLPTLITSLSPVITEALAAVGLGERLGVKSAVGFILVVTGVVIASIMTPQT